MSAARGETPIPVHSTVAEVYGLAAALAEAAAVADRRAREVAQQTTTLTTLVDNLPIAVSLVGADKRYLAFNQLFLEQMDLSPAALKVGDSVETFVRHLAACGDYGDGDVETLVRKRLTRMTIHKPEQFEATRPNGRILDVRITPLPDGGFISTRIDVTERRRREIEIEQARERLERHAAELTVARQQADRARAAADAANTAKSLFLANMSHELRTPLNAILGFSEIIATNRFGPADARYQQYGRDIQVSGEHLLRLINDLLDQSRIEIGQLGLLEVEFDLAILIDECRQVVAGRAEDGRVTLAVAVAPGLPAVRADRGRLKQVLLNLMSNAIKFTPEGGRVRITARPVADGGVAVAVADSGIGMRAEDIPAAFEPFRQVDNSLARHYDGAGLGLSLAKGLTELHGGRLDIQSELGKGTLATMWLPPARLVPAQPAPKIAAAS
jgi:signal transduction histidine kinase